MPALFSLALAAAALAQPRLTEGELKLVFNTPPVAREGPPWDPAGYLYFSGNGKLWRMDAQNKVEPYLDPSPGTNGTLVDLQKRIIACEPQSRRVIRIDRDKSVTVLADNYEGKKFNSPNDINRIDPPGKVTRIIGRELERPNGILVSPGDRYLFVADNNNNTLDGARKLWRFDLRKDGTIDLNSRKLIIDWRNAQGPDGFDMDRQGRLYVAGGLNRPSKFETTDEFKGGVFIISPEGKLLEFVAVPTDETTNVTFGGPDLKTLYITSGGSLYSIRVKTPGLSTAK